MTASSASIRAVRTESRVDHRARHDVVRGDEHRARVVGRPQHRQRQHDAQQARDDHHDVTRRQPTHHAATSPSRRDPLLRPHLPHPFAILAAGMAADGNRRRRTAIASRRPSIATEHATRMDPAPPDGRSSDTNLQNSPRARMRITAHRTGQFGRATHARSTRPQLHAWRFRSTLVADHRSGGWALRDGRVGHARQVPQDCDRSPKRASDALRCRRDCTGRDSRDRGHPSDPHHRAGGRAAPGARRVPPQDGAGGPHPGPPFPGRAGDPVRPRRAHRVGPATSPATTARRRRKSAPKPELWRDPRRQGRADHGRQLRASGLETGRFALGA